MPKGTKTARKKAPGKKAPGKKAAKKGGRAARRGRKSKYGVATAELVYELYRDGLGPDLITARLRGVEGHERIDKKTVRAIIERNEEDWDARKAEDLEAVAREKRRLYVRLVSEVGEGLISNAKAILSRVGEGLEQEEIGYQAALQYQKATLELARDFFEPKFSDDKTPAPGTIIDARSVVIGGALTPASAAGKTLDDLRARVDRALSEVGLPVPSEGGGDARATRV